MAKYYDKPANEYYATPDETVERLLSIIPINANWSYMEPCRGEADAIYKHLPERSQWAELSMGVDYLNTAFNKVDCIITNPPFSLTVPFLEKSFQEADVVIYLQRLNYLGSKGRKDFWNNHKPTNLIVLSKRPSFKAARTDNSDYAWFCWDYQNKLDLKESFYFV